MRHGAKNVQHSAKSLQHGAEDVRHVAKNVMHGAENVPYKVVASVKYSSGLARQSNNSKYVVYNGF